MSKPITEGDFHATINDAVFFGATEAGVKKAGRDCFELAKKMRDELPPLTHIVQTEVSKETFDFINANCALRWDGSKEYHLVGAIWYILKIRDNE